METKICSKCKTEKPNTNEYFAFVNKSKGLLKNKCKMCDKEYYKNSSDEWQKLDTTTTKYKIANQIT